MYQKIRKMPSDINLEELELQARETIEQTLNQLHTASLLVGQLEIQIAETGKALHALSHLIETFIDQQKQQSTSN
jgi:EAL domain-containing protein (putative c-di-GMP-specific phosphodiesterase class I)